MSAEPRPHSPADGARAAGAGDAVARYCAASSANDVEALLATLSPQAEVVSPLSARAVFKGREDLRLLLGAIYGTLRGLSWEEPIGDGEQRTAIGRCRIGPLRLDDAMVFELGEDGLIRRVRPHLRPWLATSAFALVLLPKLAPHPGLLLRALRGG